MKEEIKMKFEWLVGYLPYELRINVPKYYNFGGVKTEAEILTLDALKPDWMMFREVHAFHPIERFKPILRPLKEYKDVEEILDDFSDNEIERFEEIFFGFGHTCLSRFDTISASQLQLMYKHHIDIFQLIDVGLATDKNTL